MIKRERSERRGEAEGRADDLSSPRELAVDRALELAARASGVRKGPLVQGWMRARVLGVLEIQASREGMDLRAVVDRLRSDDSALSEIVTALRVGETRFYRDRANWEAVAELYAGATTQGPEVRALSAGCSSGEEAYTLAMVLGQARRRCRVLGVDRSPDAIAAARAGRYPLEAARDLPPPLVGRYCDVEGDRIVIRRSLADRVTFETADLCQRVPRGPFSLVFFKNVLVYLDADAGESVASRLAGELADDGLLFVATSEVPRLRAAGLEPVRAGGTLAFRRRQ